jgi:hypothetical protein
MTDSPLHSDPELKKIADKHNESVATILISWAVNRGTVVLPKSVTPSRIESNRKVISLDKEDMAVLDNMASGGRQHRFNTPAWKTDFVSSFIGQRPVLMSRGSLIGTELVIRMPLKGPSCSPVRLRSIEMSRVNE